MNAAVVSMERDHLAAFASSQSVMPKYGRGSIAWTVRDCKSCVVKTLCLILDDYFEVLPCCCTSRAGGSIFLQVYGIVRLESTVLPYLYCTAVYRTVSTALMLFASESTVKNITSTVRVFKRNEVLIVSYESSRAIQTVLG